MTELSWFEDYGEDYYKNYCMSTLEMDEAYLSINRESSHNTYNIFKKHTDCIKCPYVKEDENTTLILKKVPYYLYRITNKDVSHLEPSDDFLCEFGEEFGEFGIYSVNVSDSSCGIETIKNPVSTAFPVLTVFLIYCTLLLCVFGFIYVWKKIISRIDIEEPKKKEQKKRVKSLDTFRGISIVVMIFVNYGAGGYAVLEHACWNGLHLADLVFPWFMWIMGACVPISLMSSFKRKISDRDIFLNVLKRSIKLFCIGIFLGSGSSLEYMRIFGVLQRFGVVYFVVTIICLFLMKREITNSQNKISQYFSDIINLGKGWVAVLIIFFIHCMIIFLLAEDGCPKGYLGPGGLHDGGTKYFNCTGGATGYIDRVILGKHMYHNPTSKEVYLSIQAFDPEGILGCLTSIVHVFIGVQAGMTLLVYQGHKERLIRWLSWSVVTGIVGGALCGFSKDDGIIPVNKNLWSISFVLVTSCFAFFLLSVCYVLIDIKNWWSGKPFLFAGMNAIIMYIGHELTYGHLPMRWTVHNESHGTHFIALTENIWGTGFWVVVAYYLYTINYFFSV